jgi:hypothetical protein
MQEEISVPKRIEQIETFEKENKEARNMLKEALENDPAYLEVIEEIRASTAKRQKIKNEIMAKIANQKIQSQIKENNEELVTLKDILSVELMNFYQEKQTDEIEDQYGEKRKFKIIAKLLPKKKRFDDRDEEGKYSKNQGEMIPEGTLMRELPEINPDNIEPVKDKE